MELTREQIKALADEIAEQRAEELEQEFYEQVTEKTFRKWFEATAGHKEPYFKRGAYFRGSKFFMIKRSRVPYKKVGKHHFKPSRKEYYRQYDLAEKLMQMGLSSQKTITDDGKTLKMKLGYSDKIPSEYKGTYSEQYANAGQNGINVVKNGKMSSLDMLIIRAVHEWANKQGLKIAIDSIYKEGKK